MSVQQLTECECICMLSGGMSMTIMAFRPDPSLPNMLDIMAIWHALCEMVQAFAEELRPPASAWQSPE